MLYEVPRAVKFIGTQVDWRLRGAGGGGNAEFMLMAVEFQFLQDEKVLVVDGGDDCKTM